MIGIEYFLARSTPPRLFIVHKRHRHSPTDFELIASYYILDGTIYQSPNLLALLKCRINSSVTYLHDAVMMGAQGLRYDPDMKAYLSRPTKAADDPVDPIERETFENFLLLPK